MPTMPFTSPAAAVGHPPLAGGHELRSSAGYGNELGIPGPSRHLTPLALGLRSASLCSLPAAAAVATAPAPAAAGGTAPCAVLLPLAQEGPSALPPVLSLQPSVEEQQDMQTSSSDDGSVEDGLVSPLADGQLLTAVGLLNPGRDLRDSAWGACVSSHPPSAPPLPRSVIFASCLKHVAHTTDVCNMAAGCICACFYFVYLIK